MSFSTLRPTKEIQTSCDAIQDLFARFHEEVGGTPTSRRFEFNTDAAISIRHIICLAESIICLAKSDLAYVVSANQIARALMETCCKTLWILKPNDPFEREWRWTLYLDTASDHFERLADLKYLSEEHRLGFKSQRSAYSTFARQIRELLKQENAGADEKRYPSINQMVKQIDNPELYYFYSLLSAYTHTNFVVIEHYCKGLGTAKEQGVFFNPSDWVLPLSVTAGSFFLTALKFLGDNDFVERRRFTRDALDGCLSVIRSIKHS
jgi:hypothetical protein